MLFSLAFAASLTGPGADPEPPGKKELFAGEDWYRAQEGKEQEFVGVLRYTPRAKDVVGFGRFNPYRLEMGGKPGTREVYVGGQDELLKGYIGRSVKLTGKPVDMEVEGTMHREIWPARVELVPQKSEGPGKGK
jgi:hypothetical protein